MAPPFEPTRLLPCLRMSPATRSSWHLLFLFAFSDDFQVTERFRQCKLLLSQICQVWLVATATPVDPIQAVKSSWTLRSSPTDRVHICRSKDKPKQLGVLDCSRHDAECCNRATTTKPRCKIHSEHVSCQ